MSETLLDDPTRRHAQHIMNELPEPNYPKNYQPSFPNLNALLEAIHEVHNTEPVTTPRLVDQLLAELATRRPSVISSSCHESINPQIPIETLVLRALLEVMTVQESELLDPIIILRNRGQSAKPRSAGVERLPSGLDVVSFMGDAVNGRNVSEREPDPSRMVAMAVQSRALEELLHRVMGYHIHAAHEMLLLPYERAMTHPDPETDKKYLLSADQPWIGYRTNDPEGPHVQLLSEVENPVAIKVGPSTTAEQIAALVTKLDPECKPGKLTFMVRLALSDAEGHHRIARAIRNYDPEARCSYDPHQVTETIDGRKIRNVQHILGGITLMAEVFSGYGLELSGVNLETMHDDNRLECIDEPGQIPTHPGDVDPRLNHRQTVTVLNHAALHMKGQQ